MLSQTFRSLAVTLCLVTPCLGANYSKGAAAAAVERLMPSDGPKEYVMFNLADPKASTEQLGYMLQEAHEQNVALAICGPKLGPLREMLVAALAANADQKLDGLYLIIVADEKDTAGLRELGKPRGIHVKSGVYK
jgi:hypothetical protein